MVSADPVGLRLFRQHPPEKKKPRATTCWATAFKDEEKNYSERVLIMPQAEIPWNESRCPCDREPPTECPTVFDPNQPLGLLLSGDRLASG